MEELKLVESGFQLNSQRIVKINFFITEKIKKDNIIAKIAINNVKAERKAFVKVLFKIDRTEGYSMEVEIVGFFSWNDKIDSEIDNYLNINAPATLCSYARTTISQLSSNAGFKPLILPLINFYR